MIREKLNSFQILPAVAIGQSYNSSKLRKYKPENFFMLFELSVYLKQLQS